jgi:hypothetical protein
MPGEDRLDDRRLPRAELPVAETIVKLPQHSVTRKSIHATTMASSSWTAQEAKTAIAGYCLTGTSVTFT